MNSIDKYILMHEYNPIYLSQPHTLLEYSIDRWLFLKYIFFFILQICIKRHLLPSCLCLQLDRLWAVLSGTGIFLLEQRITVIRDQLAITCRTLLPIDKAHCTVLFSFLYISYLSYSEFIFFFFNWTGIPQLRENGRGSFPNYPLTVTQLLNGAP